MVKYSRLQSTLSPMRRICVVMVPPLFLPVPDLGDKVLAPQVGPMSVAAGPCSCSWRSTTICVAMPAWSVPGTQAVLKPAHAVVARGVHDRLVERMAHVQRAGHVGGGSWMQKFRLIWTGIADRVAGQDRSWVRWVLKNSGTPGDAAGPPGVAG